MRIALGLRPLPRAETRRRFWHAAPGFLPALLWAIPHRDPLGPTAIGAILAVCVAVASAIFVRYRAIARPGDAEQMPAVIGYAGSVLAAILLFPGDLEIGLTVLAVLAFGDGSATTGGLLFGGPALPWNERKTWTGFTCFLLVGGACAAFFHWAESAFNPYAVPGTMPPAVSLACGIGAALAGALAESIPSRINDNIRVGLAATAIAAGLHFSLIPSY